MKVRSDSNTADSNQDLKATLFVTTYEMPRPLELVCAALDGQSTKRFEVIFCDDGSGEGTRDVIEDFKNRAAIQVHHLWQEHRGFRKCRILNEGLRRSRGDLLIFLDGDCVPHRDFVRDHMDLQEPGFYCAGRRVELGPKVSQQLDPHKVRQGYFTRPSGVMLWSLIKGDSTRIQRAIRVPWDFVRSLLRMNRIDDLVGCNYSVTREDLLAINGFDEEYEGYGREDTDVEIRLQNLGLRIKSLKGKALQFHVWHPRREFTSANEARLKETRDSSSLSDFQGHRPKA